MNNQLAKTGGGAIVPQNESERLAHHFINSGLFPDVKSLSVAVVKIQAGKELGVEPFAAMRGVEVIQGKVTLNAGLMSGLIKKSDRYDYKVLERSAKRCEIEFYENAKSVGKSSYTIEEATQAGLTGKATWKSYPADMLFNRALSRGFRTYCPDLGMGGVYSEGEIEPPQAVSVVEETPVSVDAKTGEIVEAQAEPIDRAAMNSRVGYLLQSDHGLNQAQRHFLYGRLCKPKRETAEIEQVPDAHLSALAKLLETDKQGAAETIAKQLEKYQEPAEEEPRQADPALLEVPAVAAFAPEEAVPAAFRG